MTRLKDSNEIVAPGDVIAEDEDLSVDSGAYIDENTVKSKHLGTVMYSGNSVMVRPMSGRYIPEEGDTVIGEISRVSYSRWTVDLNSPYDGNLNVADATDEYVDLDEDDLTDFFDVGDAVVVKVKGVTKSMDVDLTMTDERCKKLEGGRIVRVPPSKVPRVIGKKGTMVKQINSATNCNIIVGQNGLVWIEGEKPNLAARAIKKVDDEAHIDGLTDKIGEWLEEQTGEK
jgi:exosome complex component RRP4